MTKRDFEKFIKDSIKDLPLEKQEELLKKIHYKWIDDIHTKFKDRMKKRYIKCTSCNKYSLKSKYKKTIKEELCKGVCVFSDCGYGDDDVYADVTYMVEYYVCPHCDGLTEKTRWTLKEENIHKSR